MPLTTIPITIHLPLDLPAGITIVPQIVTSAPDDAWRYTSATSDDEHAADRSVGFNPRTSNGDDVRSVDASAKANDASVETGATPTKNGAPLPLFNIDNFLNEQKLADFERETAAELERELAAEMQRRPDPSQPAPPPDQAAALIARLRAENSRLEAETWLLHEEVTNLLAQVAMQNLGAHANGHAAAAESHAAQAQAEAEEIKNLHPDDVVAPDELSYYPTDKLLSARHEIAMVMLLAGSTTTEVAEELKVSARTIGRWMRQPAFIERHNRLIRECDHSIHRRLQTICDGAVEVVSAAVRNGKVSVAMQLLKGRGFLTGEKNEIVPILETRPTAAKTEPQPFPQRGSLNGYAVAG